MAQVGPQKVLGFQEAPREPHRQLGLGEPMVKKRQIQKSFGGPDSLQGHFEVPQIHYIDRVNPELIVWQRLVSSVQIIPTILVGRFGGPMAQAEVAARPLPHSLKPSGPSYEVGTLPV